MNTRVAAVAELERRIGHGFADRDLLERALTHASVGEGGSKLRHNERLEFLGDRVLNLIVAEELFARMPDASEGDLTRAFHQLVNYQACARSDSYQRLEFLGDHVLGLIVSDMLYRAFPNADEGELSKRLADLVRKESCADVAKSLGLVEDIKLGAVGAGAGARLRKSVLGDICEAVIGAVFLDGGYSAAALFVERNWTERMRKPRRPLRDPKTVLQEWAQAKKLPTPVYREVERTGPHHDPQFRVAVDLPGLEPAEGVGGSKRAAEKVAASVMIEREGVGGSNDG